MRTYIIAEIGTSHQADLAKALEMIWLAKESGADCAKFQVVFAEEIVHPLTGDLKILGKNCNIFEKFRTLECGEAFFQRLLEECNRARIDFLASPFGLRSARLLNNIGAQAFKIASPELNHGPLLDEIRSYGKPVILSSGVSLLRDIEMAFDKLEGLALSLLHCVTAYPALEEEYNLRILRPLATLFGCPVGVSDHSIDPLTVPLCSLVAGGCLIEKHFCLRRSDPGLDDPIALEPRDFSRLCHEVRFLETIDEHEREALVKERVGFHLFEMVMGTGRKKLAPSEKDNYERTNRSLHVVEDLKRGHRLCEKDLAVLRTEKVLRPGLSPYFLSIVLGKNLVRDVASGQGLAWDDLLAIDEKDRVRF